MDESSTTTMRLPVAAHENTTTIAVPSCDTLTEILRGGAQRLLRQAIDAEVTDWIECCR